MKKKTILIVDDLRTNALSLSKMLDAEWAPRIVLDGPSALLAATEHPAPDLILLDVRMPGMDGHEVCRQLKQNERTQDIPVIFITAMEDWNDEAKGLELGAVDYITKPVRAPIVKARIRNHIALRQALAELAKTNESLKQLAIRDKLTGLFNRRKLDEALEHEVTRAKRYTRPLSLILFDIDNFKRVNDSYGHPVGDTVLQETAFRLAKTLRTSDIAGRWGGEEFLIICPETRADTAALLAERLRADYAEHDFPSAGKLTASFGVAGYRQEQSAEQFVEQVDQALYRAKESGKNRIEREEKKAS